jgi:pSer/pThr/pTyr-binding forkhead associated (FHA) protein
MVRGVICANDHFNDPRKLFCGICGVNMVQRTPVLTEGARPPLGVLVIDDGSVFQLDTHYLIGREPETAERAQSGRFRCIEITDRANKISRVHVVLELRNWDVILTDDESTNGTFVMLKDTTEWRPVPAGTEEVLVPGSRLRVGDRTLAFTTHQGR